MMTRARASYVRVIQPIGIVWQASTLKRCLETTGPDASATESTERYKHLRPLLPGCPEIGSGYTILGRYTGAVLLSPGAVVVHFY